MREFNEIKDMVYDEIENIAHQGTLSKEVVCVLGELVDILKDIGTVEMFEEGVEIPENEYSLANGNYSRNNRSGYSRNGNSYGGSYDGSYDYGNSYRGRSSYNSGYSRRGRGGYSRDDAREHMMSQLHNIMNEAQNEEDRMAVKRLIDQMGN